MTLGVPRQDVVVSRPPLRFFAFRSADASSRLRACSAFCAGESPERVAFSRSRCSRLSRRLSFAACFSAKEYSLFLRERNVVRRAASGRRCSYVLAALDTCNRTPRQREAPAAPKGSASSACQPEARRTIGAPVSATMYPPGEQPLRTGDQPGGVPVSFERTLRARSPSRRLATRSTSGDGPCIARSSCPGANPAAGDPPSA